MNFKTFGNLKNPTIMLIHGGFLGAWSVDVLVYRLKDRDLIIVPELDGYGFSTGAKITSEILMKNPDITKYAIIESGCEFYVLAPKVLLRISMRYKEVRYYKNILDKI